MSASTDTRKKLDWLESIVSPLSVILMEILWIYPWLIWTKEMSLFEMDRIPLNLVSLFFLAAVPYTITFYIPARNKVVWWLKLGLVFLVILAVIHVEYGTGLAPFSGEWFIHMGGLVIDSFGIFHPIVPALTVSVYLCWRGIRLGNTPGFLSDVYRSFLFGLVAIIFLIIVWTTSMGRGSIDRLASGVGVYVAGYFFFGLVSLAMGNFLNIRMRLARYQSAPLSSRRWFTILLTVIGGTVVAGTGIASIFSPGFINSITGFFGKITYYINYIWEYLFYIIGYVFEAIYYIMKFFVDLLGTGEIAKFVFPEMDLENVEEPEIPLTGGFDFIVLLKWLAFLLIIAGVVWLLYRASRKLRSRMDDSGIEEFSESLWSWLGFKADIRLFFSRLFERWFGSRMKHIRSGLSAIRYPEGKYPDDMDIREIYRHLLAETSTAGLDHRPYETPYEYAGRLDNTVPGIDEQMDDITDLYVNARYGESALKTWETEHANVMWRLLRKMLRRPETDANR